MQESFGEYKVLERVGAGSGAEVFRARDTRAGRTAAIKVLTSDIATDPVRGQPIADEAFQAVKLGHPNVATLYAVGEQDGRPYLVYEFVQGQTLTALLGGQAINPRRALEFAAQIADGLADAHALGVVHRALRPDTIIVSQKGTAKITDFGLGLYATSVAEDLARSGAPVPAMAYWAPEQRAGSADHRADIFALGLTLMEMLAGRPPARSGMPFDLSLSPHVAPLVTRMLDTDPDRRCDSAATVAGELRQLLAALDAQRDAPPAPPPVPPRAKPGKHSSHGTAGKDGKAARRPPSGVVVSKPAPVPSSAATPPPVAPSPRAATGVTGATGKSRPHATPPPQTSRIWWIAAGVAGVAGVLWLWLAG